MAKELPYFQFEPAEYLTKDISFCSLSAQGLFINICCFYWQRQCVLTKDQFLRRFNYLAEFEELIKEGVIDIQRESIIIKFLDSQYLKATEKSSANSANGSKGGRPKKQNESEIKADKKQNESEIKGIREDKIIEYEIKKDDNKQEREESTHETFKPTVIFTSPEIENQEQRKVAPKESENEIVVYPIEEIKIRLSEWEYELIENSCKVLKITVEEYKAGVDLFLYQQGDEGMKKDYTDVKKHFRAWLKNNITNIHKSINNQNNSNGKPQKIGGIDIETLKRNHATIEEFKRKEQDSGNNDW